MARTTTPGHAGRAIDRKHPPWCDQRDHMESARRARQIARDLVGQRRWEAGDQPVYDPSDGHYVGDDSDDRVRCQTHLLRLATGTRWPHILRSLADSTRSPHELAESLAEAVYRGLMGRPMARAAVLRDVVDAAIRDGAVEPPESPAQRTALIRRATIRGYTEQQLAAEIRQTGAPEQGQ